MSYVIPTLFAVHAPIRTKPARFEAQSNGLNAA